MKRAADFLRLFAMLLFMFIIYGVGGAFESGLITLLQLLKYVLLFGSGVVYSLFWAKRMTAVSASNRRHKKEASSFRKEAA